MSVYALLQNSFPLQMSLLYATVPQSHHKDTKRICMWLAKLSELPAYAKNGKEAKQNYGCRCRCRLSVCLSHCLPLAKVKVQRNYVDYDKVLRCELQKSIKFCTQLWKSYANTSFQAQFACKNYDESCVIIMKIIKVG